MDRGQARDDAGPDRVQGLGGRGEDGPDAGEGVQVVELGSFEEVRFRVGEGAGERGDAYDRGQPGHAVAVVGKHRHHVRVRGRGDQPALLLQLTDGSRGEILRSGRLAAREFPHPSGGPGEEDASGLVGDDGEGAGQRVSGRLPLLHCRGRGGAGAAQDQDGEPFRVQLLCLLPALGQNADLALVEGDVPPLLGGVLRGGGDDHEGAFGPQALAQLVQDAASPRDERHDEAQGDQVVPVGVQIDRVTVLDVQPNPAHTLHARVLLPGVVERAVGEVGGVHRVAEGRQVDRELTLPGAHIESPAAFLWSRDMLGEKSPLDVTEKPEPLPLRVVLLPLRANHVPHSGAPQLV